VAFSDLNLIHNPATGTIPPATWGDQIRANFVALGAKPACSVYNSAVQAVTTGGTGEVLTANSEAYDSDSMHSTSVATSRITFNTAGLYLVCATVQFAFNTTGNRGLSFKVDGTTNVERMLVPACQGANSTVLTATYFGPFAAAEFIEARAVHTVGSDLNVTLLEFSAVLQNFA
jgi:hypothetical protein